MTHANTAQEMFNVVCIGILAQGKASTEKNKDGYNECKYRAADGSKCALGLLIPDEDYKPEMETKNYLALKQNKLLPDWLSRSETAMLLQRMQSAHDVQLAHGSMGAWERMMIQIGRELNLDTSILEPEAAVT